MTEPIRLTREELYKMVWTDPVSKISKRLGVSDVAIAKVCKKLNVPRPYRGYWARLQNGYAPPKQPLPKALETTRQEYLLRPKENPIVAATIAAKPLNVDIPDKLGRAHPAVAAIRSELKSSTVDDFGRIGRSEGPLHVTKSSYSRACRLLHALFKSLESRGHEIRLTDGKVTVHVENEAIILAISEPTRRVESEPPDKWGYRRWKYLPTDTLILKTSARYLEGVRQQWSDGKRQKLEDLLGKLIIALECAPALIKAGRDEAERQRKEWEVKWLRQRRKRDVIRFTKERAQNIEKLSGDLERARQIRQFVFAVEGTESAPASAVRQARWAAMYADHLDPMCDSWIGCLSE